MTIPFTYDARKHRRFTLNGRTFRAFWHTGYRRWTVIETDPVTGDNLNDDTRWRYGNWGALERQLPVHLGPPPWPTAP